MTRSWVLPIGRAVAFLLLLGGLFALQISLGGVRLVHELPAFAIIALAVLLAAWAIRADARPNLACLGAAALFAGYAVVRALASPSPYYARADLYSLLAALTFYGLTATALASARTRMSLIVALLAFALVHVLVCLVQFGIGHNFTVVAALEKVAATTRPSGLYDGPDQLAGLLEVLGILGLSVACWSRWPKWGRVIVGYLTLVCYVGVALAGSRGGWLSVVASLAVFALLSLIALRASGRAAFWKWGVLGLVALALAIYGGTALMQKSTTLADRLERIVDLEQGRLDLWQAAIDQWKLEPWTGTGSGTYRFYGREFRAEGMQHDPVAVHNDYLNLLSEYGILGASAFALFLFVHLYYGWRSFLRLGPHRLATGMLPLSDRLALNIGALSAISACAVHSAVDFNLHIPGNALVLAFTFGLLANAGGPAAGENPAKWNLVPRIAIAAIAAILLIQCVRLLPGEYYADRARLALEAENPSGAIALANQALQYDQQNPNIFFYLGRALSALGDDKVHRENRYPYYEAALAAFDRARLLNPLDGSHPFDMALLYDRMGRFAEAEWMYGLARERDPRSIPFSEQYRMHLRLWERTED